MSISRRILEAKTLAQTICNITKNEATSTELKVLYFVDAQKNCSPQVLISKLGIVKSNLALITKKMIKDELIASKKSTTDRRAITYYILPKGKQMLDEYLDNLDKIFHEHESEDLKKSLDVVLEYLNKKV